MSVLPKNLAMIVQRLANFNRQTIRIRPMSNDQAGPGQYATFKLPTNTLVDLKCLQYIADCNIDAQFISVPQDDAFPQAINCPTTVPPPSGATTQTLPPKWGNQEAYVGLPINTQSLIERLDIVVNGQGIVAPNNDYGSLYNLLAYHLGYNPQVGNKGNHPTLTREGLDDEYEEDMLANRNGVYDYFNRVNQMGFLDAAAPIRKPSAADNPIPPGTALVIVDDGRAIGVGHQGRATAVVPIGGNATDAAAGYGDNSQWAFLANTNYAAGMNERIDLQPHDRPDNSLVQVQYSNFLKYSNNVIQRTPVNDSYETVRVLTDYKDPPRYDGAKGVQGNFNNYRVVAQTRPAGQPAITPANVDNANYTWTDVQYEVLQNGNLAGRDTQKPPDLLWDPSKPGGAGGYLSNRADFIRATLDRYRNRKVVMEGFMGFLNGKYCRFLDTAVTGPIEIRIKFAPPGVLSCNRYRDPSLLKNVSYCMKNQYMMLDTISFVDDFYRQILARRLIEGGLITIPFDNYVNQVYPIVGPNHFVQFTCATQSLDYLIGTIRDVNDTSSVLPKPYERLNNRYFTFESFAGDVGTTYSDNLLPPGTSGGYQWLVNNMHYPTWQATVDEVEALTKAAWDKCSDLKNTQGQIYTKEYFRALAFAHVICLKHHSEEEKIISGLDTRGASSMMQWMVSNLNRPTRSAQRLIDAQNAVRAAGAPLITAVNGQGSKNASIWACCTSTIEFSAGQNATIIF
jgi:hypothetical protein